MRRPFRTADCREASRARDIVTTVGTGLLGLASGTVLGLAILLLGLLTVLSAAIATNTAAPGSHQRSPSQRASPMTIRRARQIERNSAPRIVQSWTIQSR